MEHVECWASPDTITNAYLPKIWAPFYTTKAEGTGIGLSIVRSLVEQQPGATISVESHQGAGTTFRLTMPAIGADFPVRSSASELEGAPRERASADS